MTFRLRMLAVLLALPLAGHAIVMRHDVDESQYLSSFDTWPSTAYFHFRGRFGSGTGTLIAPRWVLTAGHVSMHVDRGDIVTVNGIRHTVRRSVTYAEYDPEVLGRDIGLVELETASAATPAKLYPDQDEVGQVVTFVGAGWPGNGQSGTGGEPGTIRQAHNRVEAIKHDTVVFVFDSGEQALPLEGISGPGDSGGPAYVSRDDVLYTLGISAFQDFDGDVEGVYGAREHYTRVSAYLDWIESVINVNRAADDL